LLCVITAGPAGQTASDTALGRGLTALHNFEYEEANEAFNQARRADPQLVLAYWGEAMTYHQALWRRENLDEARRILGQLGPTPEARAARTQDPRVRGLMGAVDALYGPGDAATRRQNYVTAMARLHTSFPQDDDVAAFYGLALLSTASRGLIGSSETGEGFGRALAGSAIQTQAAALFNEVLARNPAHPGALHYLIHAYDDPEHARLALDAARRYATVANGASHALHMPAHVFLQLGMWHEAEQSDRASFDASREWVARKQLPPTLQNFHALAWRQYELLQMGQFKDAQSTIDQIEPVVKAGAATASPGHPGEHQPLVSDLASMRARYAIEARRWDTLAGSTTFGNVYELFAIGMSAARTGNARAVEVVRQKLAERATAPEEGDLRPAIAIMEREMAALVEQANGRASAALEILSAAAASELALPAPLGLPAPIKPAPELLGEALVDAGRPRDAIEPFRSVLRVHANRSLSVLGLARAAAASGDQNLAREQYRQLLASYDKADGDIAELKEARTALASAPVAAARATSFVPWAAAGVVAVAVGIWGITRGSGGSGGSKGSGGSGDSRTVKQTKSRRGGKSAPALRRG